jgi:glycosyltransferase involved in cell wall biosynthesis
MRVAIYSIALNEEAHVARWFESTKDADYHLIADTGSTDDTVTIARGLGINVHEMLVDPWRFDVSRNAALALVPADIDVCIPLDLDEVMVGDWRTGLEREWAKGVDGNIFVRPRYMYYFNPNLSFYATKIHARRGYIWRHPIHEIPTVLPPYGEIETYSDDIRMDHLPDPTKSRGSYLSLLEQAVAEDPGSARMCYYLARERFFHHMMPEATKEFTRYVNHPGAGWLPERAHAYRFLAKTNPELAEHWLTEAIKTWDSREARADRALLRYHAKQWFGCLEDVRAGMGIPHRTEYQEEAQAWNSLLPDVGAVSAWNINRREEALDLGEKALALAPDDERIQTNVNYMKTAMA